MTAQSPDDGLDLGAGEPAAHVGQVRPETTDAQDLVGVVEGHRPQTDVGDDRSDHLGVTGDTASGGIDVMSGDGVVAEGDLRGACSRVVHRQGGPDQPDHDHDQEQPDGAGDDQHRVVPCPDQRRRPVGACWCRGDGHGWLGRVDGNRGWRRGSRVGDGCRPWRVGVWCGILGWGGWRRWCLRRFGCRLATGPLREQLVDAHSRGRGAGGDRTFHQRFGHTECCGRRTQVTHRRSHGRSASPAERPFPW